MHGTLLEDAYANWPRVLNDGVIEDTYTSIADILPCPFTQEPSDIRIPQTSKEFLRKVLIYCIF